jgi:glycosyltransferase involved in cell wall biosynthesis
MEPKVMIGIPTGEFARQAEFYDYRDLLEVPPQTVRSSSHGQSPARNRNLIIDHALKHECTHIFFMDDDLIIQPDTLKRLLVHDVDAVTGFYTMRNFPHQPILFDYADSEGRCLQFFPEDGNTGLVELVGAGLGCCLIKTDVFRKLEQPWIRLGELEKDHWCDDLGFFKRMLDAGFKLYCDLSVTCGHMCTVKVWPAMLDGVWHVSYDTNGTSRVSFPMLRPKQRIIPNGTDGTTGNDKQEPPQLVWG